MRGSLLHLTLLFGLTALLPACSGGPSQETGTPEGAGGNLADPDADGDGVPASEDCDDANSAVYPGAADACDALDNDCDGALDEDAPTWYPDADGDGFGEAAAGRVACEAPEGSIADGSDCDDTRAHLHPYDDDGDGVAEGCGWREVSAGGYHSCAIDSGGLVVCWGMDRDGQSAAPAGTFTAVSSGREHSCAVATDGAARCWGDGGDGRTTAPAGQFVTIAAGGDFSCGIETGGAVQCWGGNLDGQLDAPAGNFRFIDAGMAGNPHACAMEGDGSVSCWGYDGHGQGTVP